MNNSSSPTVKNIQNVLFGVFVPVERTCDTQICLWTFGCVVVITCVDDLGPSQPGIEHKIPTRKATVLPIEPPQRYFNHFQSLVYMISHLNHNITIKIHMYRNRQCQNSKLDAINVYFWKLWNILLPWRGFSARAFASHAGGRVWIPAATDLRR